MATKDDVLVLGAYSADLQLLPSSLVFPVLLIKSMVVQISMVQLVAGLSAAWIIALLIAKSGSLRSALKSLG